MDILNGMRCLCAAVEQGSLSGAAKKLGVSQPAVSQVISGLETHFGVPLINREHRGIGLTNAGRVVCDRGRQMLVELEQAHIELDGLRNELSGKIRVTTVQALAQTVVGNSLLELQKSHPKLRAELVSTDEVVDLDKENIDFAIRVGSPGHGGGTVRRIGEVESVFVASPQYLAEAGTPQDLEQLSQLNYVQYREDRKVGDIKCKGPDGDLVVNIEPGFLAQQPSLLAHAIEVGLGYTISPLFFVAPQIQTGKLVEVIPGIRPHSAPLYLVIRNEARNSLRAQTFQEFVFRHLSNAPGIHLNADLLPAA